MTEISSEQIEEITETLSREILAGKHGSKTDLEPAINRLEENTGGEKQIYSIWRYSHKQKIENHFQDFGYQDPDELMYHLEELDGEPLERDEVRELEGIKYALSSVQRELEDDN